MAEVTPAYAEPDLEGYNLYLTPDEAEALSAVLGSVGGSGARRSLISGISIGLDDAGVDYDYEAITTGVMTGIGEWAEVADTDTKDYALIFKESLPSQASADLSWMSNESVTEGNAYSAPQVESLSQLATRGAREALQFGKYAEAAMLIGKVADLEAAGL